MSNFQDFSRHRYQIEKELGHNHAGGRVTYLATDTQTQQAVVLKQFQFAKSGSSWADYDAYDCEIQLLKQMNHPGIPCYLDAFQTEDCFCMVQEYKNAESLAVSRSFNPEQIRRIAIAALEVLVYLQNRMPPVIHRDIKPENILVDDQGNVFLVDFGFARVGEGEVGVSSVVKGTLGFMPPEQLFNRQLTEASDLYGLGMTLICLLTGTKSDRIGDLVDISYRVSFKHLLPKLNMHWVNWLEKMVEPRIKDRFPNAVAALAAIPTSPLRPPEAQFSQSTLGFRAKRSAELLLETVVVTNPIPDTTLEGHWEVAPHPQDPPGEVYRWIAVDPPEFVGNQVECQVYVDTCKLVAGKIYHRRLLLHTNTLVKTYSLSLQIHTVPLPRQANLFSYSFLSLFCLFAGGFSWLISWGVLILGTVAGSANMTGLGAMVGTAIGLELCAWIMRSSGWRSGSTASTIAAVILGIAVSLETFAGEFPHTGSLIATGAIAGIIGGMVSGLALGTTVENLVVKDIPKWSAIAIALLTTILGTSLGVGVAIGFAPPSILIGLSFSSLTLGFLILHWNLKRMKAIFNHSTQRGLIKP